jgi:Inner membrane protein YgaP-like, transmembrane domain
MNKTRNIHDGIVGAVITVGVLLGVFSNPLWFWLPGIVGVLMIQSAFTGFCPVYFLLGRCGLKE